MTVLALVIPSSRVLCHVPLPITLDGELEAALVANKRFHSTVRAHVLLKKGFAEVRLFALSALEGPLPLVLVLPHVVHQVALRHKLLLADVTGVRFLTVVFHPYVLIDGCFVKDLATNWTSCVETCFLPLGHEAALVFLPNVPRE